MRIVFFGTPDFAIPSLDYILQSNYQVLKVVTNPDKKSGRGRKSQPSPISVFCKEKMIECLYCSDFNDNQFYAQLKSMNPDLFVVVAFKILPEKIINIPRHGSINVHPSLLPKYRGSAPIQHAILNCEKETGVTIFKLNRQIDSGHIIIQEKYLIDKEVNFSDLYSLLSKFGAKLLIKAIDLIDSGAVKYIPQKEYEKSSKSDNTTIYAKKINTKDCLIDWGFSAEQINAKIRAFSKTPGAFTFFKGKKVKIFDSTIYREYPEKLNKSICRSFKGELLVGTKDTPIQINFLQFEGKKVIKGKDFINSNFFINNKTVSFG